MRALPLVLGACLGCTTAPAPRLTPVPAADEAWSAVVERFTRHVQIYQGLDIRIFAAATLHTDAFRAALQQREAALAPGAPADAGEAGDAGAGQADAAEEPPALELTLGVWANERPLDDFEGSQPYWTLLLATGAAEARPLSVERVGRATAKLRSRYPWLDEFWTVYRVRFPMPAPGSRQVSLKLTSAAGQGQMDFDSGAR